MVNVKCPGQDRSFWRPDDIYDVTCARCGRAVEFFRTDSYRFCPGCGGRITNPQLAAGCAQWCEHAIACLGYDPKHSQVHAAAPRPTRQRLVDRLKALRKSLSSSDDSSS